MDLNQEIKPSRSKIFRDSVRVKKENIGKVGANKQKAPNLPIHKRKTIEKQEGR